MENSDESQLGDTVYYHGHGKCMVINLLKTDVLQNRKGLRKK